MIDIKIQERNSKIHSGPFINGHQDPGYIPECQEQTHGSIKIAQRI
jgi:hypothetical protein